VRGTGGAAADSALVGDADVDPAPVLDAHAARDEAIVLEPGYDARERALTEVHGGADVLHPPLLLLVLRCQAVEDLELAHAEPVLLECSLERAVGARVPVEQIPPGIDQGVTDRRVRKPHAAPARVPQHCTCVAGGHAVRSARRCGGEEINLSR